MARTSRRISANVIYELRQSRPRRGRRAQSTRSVFLCSIVKDRVRSIYLREEKYWFGKQTVVAV